MENIETKTVRTLPLLWDKWQYASIKGILYSDIETCLQMDKQAKSEEKFHL